MKFSPVHILILVALLLAGAIGAVLLKSDALLAVCGGGGVGLVVMAVVTMLRGGGGPPSPPAVLSLLIAGLMLTGACASFRPMASTADGTVPQCAAGPCYSPERCDRVRAKFRIWGAVSYGTAAISGGGGLASAFPDDDDFRLGLGIGSAALAVIAAVSVYLRGDYADELQGFCGKAP